MKKIRVLIVDDEPISRWGIRAALESEPDVEIIGECANGVEAVAAIQEWLPDIVFLDIQMPGLDGFRVLEKVGIECLPEVIFITAYDQYAIRAFDVHALDYLLKPFDRKRLIRALQRARNNLSRKDSAEINHRLLALLADHRDPSTDNSYLQRLVIKSSGRIFFLDVDDVDWIESAENYLQLHTANQSHLLRETMSRMEVKLDPRYFLRIRHSIIVNIRRIKELRPLFNGEYSILLRDGTELTSSRRYRKKLNELVSNQN